MAEPWKRALAILVGLRVAVARLHETARLRAVAHAVAHGCARLLAVALELVGLECLALRLRLRARAVAPAAAASIALRSFHSSASQKPTAPRSEESARAVAISREHH